MKKPIALVLPLLLLLAIAPWAVAQSKSKKSDAASTAPAKTNEQENLEEYVTLLRTNVRQQKAEIMGSILGLNIDQSAKFWPIYSEYDAELTKLNDQRLANIQDYARNYDTMTDAKADELVQNAMDYRKQRAELLAKYYERVKASLGAVQAARFLQVEDQLLLIIDLQIASSLPVVGQGS